MKIYQWKKHVKLNSGTIPWVKKPTSENWGMEMPAALFNSVSQNEEFEWQALAGDMENSQYGEWVLSFLVWEPKSKAAFRLGLGSGWSGLFWILLQIDFSSYILLLCNIHIIVHPLQNLPFYNTHTQILYNNIL